MCNNGKSCARAVEDNQAHDHFFFKVRQIFFQDSLAELQNSVLLQLARMRNAYTGTTDFSIKISDFVYCVIPY